MMQNLSLKGLRRCEGLFDVWVDSGAEYGAFHIVVSPRDSDVVSTQSGVF